MRRHLEHASGAPVEASLIATAAARDQPASPEHRRFKGLLSKIEAARLRLAAWHEQLPLFARAHADRVDR